MGNYSCRTFPNNLPVSHNTSVTDGQTDKTTTMTTARPLLKYGRLKNKRLNYTDYEQRIFWV